MIDEPPFGAVLVSAKFDRSWLQFQPIDTTHWLKRSAGVSKFNVFLGRSLSPLATDNEISPVS
jgi:hypothetical protein